MASQHRKEKTYRFSLPLVFKRRKNGGLEEVTSDDYSSIVNELDQLGLNIFIKDTLPDVEICAISLVNERDLSLTLSVNSESQLQKVFEVAKRVERGGQNALSRAIKDYCSSIISLELSVGNRLGDELYAFADMTTRQLGAGLIELDDIDEEVKTTKPEGMKTRSSKETAKETAKDNKKSVRETVIEIEKRPNFAGSFHNPGSYSANQHSTLQEKSVSETVRQMESSPDVAGSHLNPGSYSSENTNNQAIQQTKAEGGVLETVRVNYCRSSVVESHQSPGSYPSGNKTSGGFQQTQEEPPLMDKLLVVYIPTFDGYSYISTVKLKSQNPNLNDQILKPHGNESNMYEICLQLPSLEMSRMVYYYEITAFKYYLAKKLDSFAKVYSTREFFCNDHFCQRDIVSENSIECIANHLRDILFFSGVTSQMERSILEINALLHGRTATFDKVKLLVKKLLDGKIHSPTSRLLLLVVLGNLVKNIPFLKQTDVFDGEESMKTLQALKKFKLKELPQSCQEYMVDLCMVLCLIYFEKRYCLLYFMDICQPFLDSSHYNSVISRQLKSREKIDLMGQNKTALTPLCKRLCLSLFSTCISGEHRPDDDPKTLMRKILLHLPVDVALQIANEVSKTFQSSDKTILVTLKEEVFDIIVNKVKTEQIKIKSGFSITHLLELWRNVILSGLNIEAETFEKTFLDILVSKNKNINDSTECIKKLLYDKSLFGSVTNQMELLEILSDSECLFLHETFIACAKMDKYRGTFNEHKQRLCMKWMKRAVTSYVSFYTPKVTSDVFGPYFVLSELLTVESLQADEDTLSELFQYVFKQIQKESLPSILLKTDDEMESRIHPLVLDVFKGHLSTMVKKQHRSQRPEEILAHLSPYGRLTVNSRLTAQTVCVILDDAMYFNELQKENEFAAFSHIVHHMKSWKMILKADGKSIDVVRGNSNFKTAKECLKTIKQRLDDQDVKYTFLDTYIERNIHGDILELFEISSFGTSRKIWKNGHGSFKQVLKNVDVIKRCLSGFLKHAPEQGFPVGISEMMGFVTKFENDVKNLLCVRQLREDMLPKEIKGLLSSSNLLQNMVHSRLFWNVSLDKILSEYEKRIAAEEEEELGKSEDEIIRCIPILFNELHMPSDNGEGEIDRVIIFLDVVLESGGEAYKNEWGGLMTDPEFLMKKWLVMFRGTDIMKEIDIAEKCLGKWVARETKVILERLDKLESIEKSVEAMKNAMLSCKIEDEHVSKAIESFNLLFNKDCPNYSFRHVGQLLVTVFSIAQPLHEDTIVVLSALGNASNLIDFLRNIAGEDIRNLIDAVEDISEQHVQESTVAALIEVKRFLHPILNCDEMMDARWMFEIIDKQVKSNEKVNSKMPMNIEDCMNNLHNLKSLYNNVANRSEQTKEIIMNIVKKGKFSFTLNKQGTDCEFKASYKTKKVENSHSKTVLSDLRSRALLLMNKYQVQPGLKGYELDAFVSYIDLCMEIADLVVMLHITGHIRFKVYCKTEEGFNLSDLKTRLYCEHREWCNHLTAIREKYYLVSFLQGFHIHKLHNYLEKDWGLKDLKACEVEVQTLLKMIHPKIQAFTLREQYLKLKTGGSKRDEYLFMDNIGNTLHFCFGKCSLFERSLKSISVKDRKLGDVVQNGRLLVAQLEESSPLVTRTVVTLFSNTVQRLPEPNQVLFCTRQTTWAEIELLLFRCSGAYDFFKKAVLYCIADVELLPNEVQFKLVEALKDLEPSSNFHLAVICCGSRNHPFIDELSDCLCKIRPLTDNVIEMIFQSECPDVLTVTSETAGLGKTTQITRNAFLSGRSIATLHISGPMTKERIVSGLTSLDLKEYNTLHIDIGSTTSTAEIDTLLFELIVMGFVSTGKTSVYLPTSCISIEIANSIQDSLRKSLQTAMLFRRLHIVWQNYENLIVSREINSPVQVVCHFLHSLEKSSMDSVDIFLTGQHCVKPLPTSLCRRILQKYFPSSPGISFSLLNIFLNVLADQLKKMSSSSFFRTSRIKDMVGHKTTPTVKSSLVKALLDVSIEFSRRSVEECRATQLSTISPVSVGMESSATVIINQVEGMIRWEDSNHLMYVFHNQNIQTLSAIYRDKSKVPANIKTLFESQMKKDLQDYMKMDQNELQIVLQKICRTNPMMIKKEKLQHMSQSYALTPDNLLKMILIILRIKSSIPVLVMGETGCGKTSLIRYLADMCEVRFHVLNIHAGVEEGLITEKITTCNKQALGSPSEEYWLFFDEINTSEYVGMISDIICHHSFLGERLAPNLIIMGACNPYKLRSESAIFTAGLKGKVRTDQLSRLVYRVLPLPEMLVDYVWDFGSLNVADEKVYIQRMIESVFLVYDPFHKLFTELLAMSQAFIRDHDEISCSVSLRDVQRCKTLTRWFLEILPRKSHKKSQSAYIKTNIRERAIILSLAHCYHSRIAVMSLRKSYREEMARIFSNNSRHLYEYDISGVITGEQEDILNRMDLPPGTAKNTALRENVFVLLVCILNRIPIFVVGKPGCSKSLSMQVIRNNLRGADSKDDFFKTLPQLYCVSFQGSESSTSDGIVKVFEKAERYQETNKADSVLSVVILDEIGLAEISRFNPLKVLHNLLEPDGKDRPNVAVVGISNWSLDASKMNRAIHLSRPDMDEQELYETGKSISDSFVDKEKPGLRIELHNRTRVTSEFATSLIDDDLKNIAESYYQYTRKLTFQNFHGLRDFYSLIKFFSKEVARNPKISAEEKKFRMVVGLERNFGGLPDERQKLLSEFKVEEFKDTSPVVDLIRENVADPLARHLMLITSGESVLGVIEKSLDDAGRKDRELIIGSQFEEDLTDDYNYRILNRIILCMEQGLVLILKDLENIYGSLYDMLNQNYTMMGKKKNCRVALGPYSNPICHVADTFRCIVLVSDSKIKHSDPPFLNRFEKQYLRFSDIITLDQREIIQNLEIWMNDISNCGDFDEYDSFPVYSKDMATSLVLRNYATYHDAEELLQQCKKDLLWVTWPEVIVRLTENKCENILYEAEEITDTYLGLPIHQGIEEYIASELSPENSYLDCQMVIMFTKSNIHSKVLQNIPGYAIQIEKLGAFKSEKQLFAHMQTFWLESSSDILFLQCSAVDDEKHIMLAKTLIEKLHQEFVTKESVQKKHVFLIIHVDSSKGESNVLSQINFMSCWKLVALDSLEKQKTDLTEFFGQSLLDAFMLKKPLNRYIQEQLFWAFTKIKYEQSGRDVEKLTSIMRKIEDSEHFLEILEELISKWIVDHCPDIDDTHWLVKVASNRRSLQTSSSFIVALEAYILNIIDIPMVKYLYVLERQNMIETFFVQDQHSEDRITAWIMLVSHEDQFNIMDIPDNSGPESYICNTHMLELKMPFSMHVYEHVEETMDEFMYSVKILKSKCDIDPEDDLPKELLDEIQKTQKLIVHQKLPRLIQYNYSSAASDYLDDFCTFKSMQICPGPLQEDIISYMKCVIREKVDGSGDDLLDIVTSLHIAFWNYSALMTSQIQLFAICKDIFTQKDLSSVMLLCEEEEEEKEEEKEENYSQAESVEDEYDTHRNSDSEAEMMDTSFDQSMGEKEFTRGWELNDTEPQQQCDTNITDDEAEQLLVVSNEEKLDTMATEYGELIESDFLKSPIDVNEGSGVEQNNLTKNDEEIDQEMDENTEYLEDMLGVDVEHVELGLSENDDNSQDMSSTSMANNNETSKEVSGLHVNLHSTCSYEGLVFEENNKELSEKENDLDNEQLFQVVSEENVDRDYVSDSDDNDLTWQESESHYDTDVKDDVTIQLPANKSEKFPREDISNISEGNRQEPEENYEYLPTGPSLESYVDDNGVQEDMSMGNTEDSPETDLYTKEILVQLVCEKMLPTVETLKYYSSIDGWSIKANNVLALVVKVNPDSDLIHHLRICSDIVLSLVIPYNLSPQVISTVAHHLLTEKLDSSAVYEALRDVTDRAPVEASSVCHRILSTYFLRCLLTNPESMALHSLLDMMCSETFLCRNLSVYKPVLSLAFQLELDEDQMCMLKILKDGILDESEHETMDESSDMDTSFFLKLNSTVCDLVQTGNKQCPFMVILVDMVEDMFTRSISECEEGYEEDEVLGYLVSSHDTLTNKPEFDLQHVFAAGFFKAYTHHVFTDMMQEHGEIDSKCQEYFKAILSIPDSNVAGKTLKRYIMKIIAFEKTSNQTFKQLCELKNIFPDFDEIYPSLKDSLKEGSLDNCLTQTFIDESKQDLLEMLKELESSEFKDLKKGLDKESSDVCLSILASYSERKFYNSRSHTVPNDHIKSLSLCFTKACVDMCISDSSKHFLKCLTGTDDFPITYMNHSEQTPMSDFLLNRFLVSLLTVCLMQAEKGQNESFFMNCVFGGNLSECGHLPGREKSGEHLGNYLWASLNDQTGLLTCKSSMRMVVPLSTEESFACPDGSSHVHQLQKGIESKSIHNMEDELSLLYSTRQLSPLACQMLFLITKGCFIGSLAIKKSVPEQLQKIFDHPAIDIPQNLWSETKIHWKNIGKLLGVGEHTTGFFLHSALNHLKTVLFEKCPQMKTTEEKLTWEVDFNSRLQDVFKEHATLQCQLLNRLGMFRGEANELEDGILETGMGKDEALATIFRRKSTSSYNNFVAELHQEHNKFPLLVIVIQYMDKLRLPCHIRPIIQWHMAVVTSVNYVMRKQACLNMTVLEFTQHIGDKEKTETLRKHFQAMQKSWAFVKKHIQADISENMTQMHYQMKMESCIMYTKDCVMYRVLEYLVQIQNEFIDHTLCISKRCESVSYLRRSESVSAVPCVKLVDITKMQLVHFNPVHGWDRREDGENGEVFEWEQIIHANSQSETLYGQGQKIWYDFQAVERLLASKLVPGKVFILCNFHELPKIVFTDELYKNYVSLSNDVKSKVKQTALSSDLVTSIYNKHKDDRTMCSELMTQVGMIMTLLNKTGGEPERCLVDYVEDMKNVLTKKFSDDLLPSPSSLVKLEHIVALYEVLEELNADSIIDALNDEFRTETEIDHVNILKDVVKSQRRLGSCILQACKRFITRCLSIQEVNSTSPLIEYLADISFWPEGVCDGHCLKTGDGELKLIEIFPKQVMVEHIASLVTVIEEELKRIRDESNQMSKMAASWKSSRGNTPVAANTRKKVTVVKRRKGIAL